MVKAEQIVGGRYRIIKAISRGGAATIYAVEHAVLGTRHALKVLRAPTGSSRRRLLREGQLQARLRHEHLILVTDAFAISDQDVGLVMELAEGPSLSHHLRLHTPDLEDALRIGEGILRGVAYAHSAGLVHRDLKPANIMLCGPTRIPRVADFGLVKRMVNTPQDGQTRLGVMMGTPGYMPPEQYADAARVDARADVFALGCVLYELLAGRAAFPTGPAELLMRKAVRGDYDPLPESIPARLRATVEGALEPDPVRRTPSVGAMLEQWLHDSASQPITGETIMPLPDPRASGSLPTTSDRFIGRDTEQATLERLLMASTLVTLRGPGGTGKTRLSLETGHALQPRFSGGVWFIDLSEARTLSGVCGATAQVLGVPLQGSNPADAIGWVMRRRGDALFILDNFEQVVEHARETVGQWRQRAPSARFLVTSRIPLELSGEQLLNLRPFTPPDEDEPPAVILDNPGARLLVDRTRSRASDFTLTAADAPLVARLLRGLDGLPLAIELVAPRLATRPLEVVYQRLAEQRLGISSRRRDRPGRQKTLRATIDWSWALLSPTEQAALAGCAVFEGPFDLEAAEAVLESEEDIEDVLERLVEQSLLRQDRQTGRYALFVSIRDYAAERLAAAPIHAALRRRHLTYFASLSVEAVVQRGLLDDLVAAAQGGGEEGAAAAACAGKLFRHQGPIQRVVPILKGALASPGLSSGRSAWLWVRLADCQLTAMALEDATESLGHAITAARLAEDRVAEGMALMNVGIREWMRGRYPEALDACTRAEALLEASGDMYATVEARSHRANILRVMGRIEEAGPLHESALRLGRATSTAAEMLALQSTAVYYDQSGRTAEALQGYQRALAWLRQQGNRAEQSSVLGNMAFALRHRGRFEEARRAYQEAHRCARDIGDRLNEGMWSLHLARLAFIQGDTDTARTLGIETLEITRSCGDERTEGFALRVLTENALRDDQRDEARRWLADMAGKGDWIISGSRMLFLGELALREADNAAAREHLTAAEETLKRGDREGTLRSRVLLGMLALAEGDREGAEAAMAQVEKQKAIPMAQQELVADFAVLLRG